MATNHWSVSIGSIATPVRSPRGTLSLCLSVFSRMPERFEVGDDRFTRVEAVHAAVFFGRVVVDLGVERQDRNHRQLVPLADRVVVEVVRRSDLDAAGAELEVNVGVGDDRDLAVGERQLDALADHLLVTLVVGVHHHRGIAEHRLGRVVATVRLPDPSASG